MVCQHIFKERALVAGDDGIVLHAADLHDLLHERLGDEILLAVLVIADDDIAFDRVQRDGEVAGQCPDRGRPDDEREVLLLLVRELALIVVQGELDIDRGAGIVLIFDLGLSQRRLIVVAPVDGLQALIDVALFVHRAEDLDLLGLKAGGHGLIRVLPVGHDAEALEALHLHVNIMLREVMAGGAELRDGHGLVVELVLLDDGGLDGHTVVVPAGDVRGVVPAHGRRADHKVLDALVERVAHVQRAVGERRAVVQGKAGLALVLFEQFVVKVEFLPVLQHIRLAHRKPAAHRKARLVHVERLFVFHNSSCKNKAPRALAQGDKLPRYHLNSRASKRGHSPSVTGSPVRAYLRFSPAAPRGSSEASAAALHRPAALFARQNPVLVLFIAYISYSVPIYCPLVKKNPGRNSKNV